MKLRIVKRYNDSEFDYYGENRYFIAENKKTKDKYLFRVIPKHEQKWYGKKELILFFYEYALKLRKVAKIEDIDNWVIRVHKMLEYNDKKIKEEKWKTTK